MARVPVERVPELIKQLPRLLDQIRPLVLATDAMKEEDAKLIAKQLVWVDDGIEDGSADDSKIIVTIKKP